MSEATIDVSLNRNFETNVARPMGNTPPKVFVNYASYALAELYSYVCVFEVLKGKVKNFALHTITHPSRGAAKREGTLAILIF